MVAVINEAPTRPEGWRALRLGIGLSTSQAARRAGVSRQFIWALESDGRAVSGRLRRLVALAYGVEVFGPSLPLDEEAA
jgi:transcriptional regulator with XRE-family HTH domain